MTGQAHRTLREQVGAYALGQLTGEQWREVNEHLEVCGACQADLDDIAPVAGLLGAARERLDPDALAEPGPEVPELSPALIAEVRAADAPVPIRRRARLLPAAAAALVAALAAGTVGFVAGSAGTVADVPREAVAVSVLDAQVQASADVVAHTWGMEVKLVATGFTEGAAYTVTVTDDAGRTVGAGEFLGTGPEQMSCNLNSSVLRAAAATVEVTDSAGTVVLEAAV